MAGIVYLLDTNVFSDLLRRNANVYTHLEAARSGGDDLCICQPVYYEVLRGPLWAGASAKEHAFHADFLPLFRRVSLTDDDWKQAAYFWAVAVGGGK